jgi:hypothetical protein
MSEKVKAFDYSINLQAALLWQYNDAVRLQSLIEQKQAWYEVNASEVWNNWYRDFFNLSTATEDGLVVWSIILGLQLYTVGEVSPPSYPAFGFSAYGGNFFDFNFANDLPPVYGLTTEQKRLILQIRYFQLTTRATVPDINAMLVYLFGAGNAYVLDGLDMTMTYVFVSVLDDSFLSALQTLDVLPRPSGVELLIAPGGVQSFGFADFGLNYDNNFFRG